MSQIQVLMSQEWILTSHLDNTKKERTERVLNTRINQIQRSQSKGLNVTDSDFITLKMDPDVSLG